MNAVGADVDERLNNSIVKIAMLTTGGPLSQATQDLAVHWRAYWDSAERRNVAATARLPKLRRYAKWYARAWALLTPEQRDKAPDPRTLDVSFGAAVDASIKSILDGAQAAADAGVSASQYVAEQSSKLAKAIAPTLSLWLTLAVIGAIAYAYSKRKG